jgi:uncharacterized membrane protein YdjX (TVP38/TMEM64 family)
VIGRNTRAALRLATIPAIVVLALLVAWKLGYFDLDRRRQFVETVQRWRVTPQVGPLFIAVYVLAIATCLPVAVLTLLGGAIFGWIAGAILSAVGALLGTVIVHYLARSVALGPTRRLFGGHPLLKQLSDHGDVRSLFQLRVLPVAPFGVLDYVAGVAGVPLRPLLLATTLGILPSVITYSYVGAQFLSGLVMEGEATRRGLWIAGAVSLFMLLLSVTPTIVRRMRD